MRRPDPHDVIGTPPATDLGPLFAHPSTAEAEAELRKAIEPAPAPRAKEVSQSFTPPTQRDMDDAVERIKHEVREPLIALALQRKDAMEKDRIGVTAKDARAIADTKGLSTLLGHQQRAWSWLSTWLGDLARSGNLVKYRINDMTVKRMGDNGNEHVVYLHPYDHRARHAA